MNKRAKLVSSVEEDINLDLEEIQDAPESVSKPSVPVYKAADSMAKLRKKVALKNYVAGKLEIFTA